MQALVRLVPFETRKGTSQEGGSEQKRYMLEERCLFLLTSKKEQAIDEYYRQVGEGWLFCGIFAAI